MSNTFTSAGTYYVSLTVTDDDGATDTATVEVGEGWETQHTFADSHTSSNTAVITAEDEVYVRTVNGNYTATITSSDKDEMDQIAADAANELSLTTGSQGSSDTVQIGSAGTTTAISDSNFVHGSTEVGGLLPGWVPGDVDLFEHSFADWHDGGLAEVVVSAAAIAAPAASSEVFTEFTLEGDASTELDVQYSGRWEVHINAILGGTDSDVGVFVRDVTNSENGQGDLGDYMPISKSLLTVNPEIYLPLTFYDESDFTVNMSLSGSNELVPGNKYQVGLRAKASAGTLQTGKLPFHGGTNMGDTDGEHQHPEGNTDLDNYWNIKDFARLDQIELQWE